MIAAEAVHTTGINWESVGIISGIISAWVIVLLTAMTIWLSRRDKRLEARNEELAQQNNEIKDEITASVNHLSEVLLAKLETKEAVNQISVRLARVEGAAGLANPFGGMPHASS